MLDYDIPQRIISLRITTEEAYRSMVNTLANNNDVNWTV